jgi:hypothetical protein
MTPPFSVRTTPAFERVLKKLLPKHPELPQAFRETLTILETDPYNHTRAHNIKKLVNVDQGDGQWGLRMGRWRFRYDIYGSLVLLVDSSLRREDTY